MSSNVLVKPELIGYNMLMAEPKTETKWVYSRDDDQVQAGNEQPSMPEQVGPGESILWTASEFIDKHKGLGWYLSFIAGILLLSAATFLFTKDYISAVVITLAGLTFIVVTRKKPEQLSYEVNNQGIQIGAKFYQYGMFKSFDVALDGGIKSIELIPLKRIMPEISIYFPPEQETAIVSVLSAHLPHHEQSEHTVDKWAKKLRF